jgi:SAM-dependent methyltransferase
MTADGEGGARCPICGHHLQVRDGIYRALTRTRATAGEPFAHQYRLVRGAEGRRSLSPDSYRALPDVAPAVPADPLAAEWRLRRESWSLFLRHGLAALPRGAARIVELGAGCGWLSHRLASLGHHLAAVDRLDDEADGLGVCRFYSTPIVAVQADFDELPFAAAQFDAAVFAGSLHYAPDPAASLAEAARVLKPSGVLAVIDSPAFVRDADGEVMVASSLRAIAEAHRLETPIRPGRGFLTFASIERACAALGRRVRFYPTRGPLAWRMRRARAGSRLRRAPAAFGVWVAR